MDSKPTEHNPKDKLPHELLTSRTTKTTGFERSPQSSLHPTKGELLLLFFNIGNMSCSASTWCGGGSRKNFSTVCSAEAAKGRGAPTSPRRRIRSTAPRFAILTAERGWGLSMASPETICLRRRQLRRRVDKDRVNSMATRRLVQKR